MSDCRWGVRPCPVREYGHDEPIRGKMVFEDGTELPFTKARYVNGKERALDHFEADGLRYVKAPVRDWDSEAIE